VEKLEADYKEFVATIGETHLVEGTKFLRSFLDTSQNVIFEGAQGALLDTEYPTSLFAFFFFFLKGMLFYFLFFYYFILMMKSFGFFPYVTATRCTPKNALTLLDECSVEHNCLQIGALRSYLNKSEGLREKKRWRKKEGKRGIGEEEKE